MEHALSIGDPRDLVSPAAAPTFEAVYDEHLSYVWHTLRRLGAPDREREDLAHDVFMVVHRRLHTFDPSRALKPWLFGIAFRVMSDHRRRARVQREVLDEAPDQRPHAAPSAEAALIADDRRRLVLAALAELPLERRAVFVLYELDDAPMREIADNLDLPVNTCYSHLRRARRDFADAVARLRAGADQ